MFLKLLGPKESAAFLIEDSGLVLGLIGLCSLLVLWPGILILHALDLERFVWPSKHTLLLVCLNGGLDTVYQVFLVIGLGATSPIFMASGVMLTVPASIIYDRVVHGYAMSAMSYVGAVMVLVGFLVLNRKGHAQLQHSAEGESESKMFSRALPTDLIERGEPSLVESRTQLLDPGK